MARADLGRLFSSITNSASPRAARIKALSAIAVFVVAVLAANMMSQLVLSEDWKGLGRFAIAVGAIIFAVKILTNWRQGLYIFFAWLFFEDFARKYLGNNAAIFFAKDFLVVLIYVSFFLAKLKGKEKVVFRPQFFVPLMLFVCFAFIQMFNPGSPSVLYGALGMKLYFLYFPLMYLGYSLMESEEELRHFFLFSSVLILVVVALGVAQSILGSTFLNPTVIQDEIRGLSTLYRVSPITGRAAYRPNSVFVSAGRFQDLIIIGLVSLLGFGGYLILRTKKSRTIVFVTIGALIGAALMSASRGVVMWTGGSFLVIVAAFVWGAPWRQKEATRVVRSIQRVVMLGGMAIVLLAVAFPEEVNSRIAIYNETLNPYSTASELVFRARDYPLRNFIQAFNTDRWVYGYGTGTASLGIQYVAHVLHVPGTGVTVENGYGQLVVELGIFGLLLWLALGFSVCRSAWRLVKHLRG